MTKKEINAMSNEELIVQLAFTVNSFSRGYKIYKCDLKDFENITNELINRDMLSKENVEKIKHWVTL